jgi:hypothetical protein
MTIEFDILGAGIAAPGLPDWASLETVLAGGQGDPEARPAASQLLSPRERRRAPAAVKLSFPAAEQACAMAGLDPSEPVAVFSSGMGDLDITDYLCRSLVESPELLSPTRFHNSVHNAASGYWSIGAGAHGDVTAMSGWRDSVVAGLTEALGRIACDPGPVLLVLYDDVAQGPMRDLWPCQYPFGAALVLAPPGTATPMASMVASSQPSNDVWPNLPPLLSERLKDNPSARILPLLALLAGTLEGTSISLAAAQGPGLRIDRVSA